VQSQRIYSPNEARITELPERELNANPERKPGKANKKPKIYCLIMTKI
jgi:hypothetical protein